MPTADSLECKVRKVEGFDIEICHHRDGKNVRGDHEGFKRYPYKKAANGRVTVAGWIKGRFKKHFAGWDVIVKNSQGARARSSTTLETVRDGYPEAATRRSKSSSQMWCPVCKVSRVANKIGECSCGNRLQRRRAETSDESE